MTNISISFFQELKCAHKGQGEAVKPVTITSRTKVGVASKVTDVTQHFGTMVATLEYEVFCPNCARVEFASACDLFTHKCNCGYGVSVEMLRASPN